MDADKKKNRSIAILQLLAENGYEINDLIQVIEGIPQEKLEGSKEMTLSQKVRNILMEMGMPMNIKGYWFIKTAIIYCVEEVELLGGITKELYPKIAKKFDTTPSKVERVMRHAIEATFERGNLDVIEAYFGSSYSRNKGKPVNSEFIAVITDFLLEERQ